VKTGRVPCCVPFCGRTAPDRGDGAEILCGKHWRLVRRTLRRRHAWAVRRWGAALARGDIAAADRAGRLEDVIWRAIKRQAIEISAGISG